MTKYLKQIGIFILLPLGIYSIFLVFCLYLSCGNFDKAFGWSSSVITSVTVIIGSIWAYKKFDIDKKRENLMKIKALLFEFERKQEDAKDHYQMAKLSKWHDLKCVFAYREKLDPFLDDLKKQVHLALYLSNEVREKILFSIEVSVIDMEVVKEKKVEFRFAVFKKEMEWLHNQLNKEF